jgi:hypothetical protein
MSQLVPLGPRSCFHCIYRLCRAIILLHFGCTKTCRPSGALSSLGCIHVFVSFMQVKIHLAVTSGIWRSQLSIWRRVYITLESPLQASSGPRSLWFHGLVKSLNDREMEYPLFKYMSHSLHAVQCLSKNWFPDINVCMQVDTALKTDLILKLTGNPMCSSTMPRP